eukprot:TRINITY_DN45807_c0_g1_i1.p1 TRINITY_DN45807_c0_g1~~TRINITY_DN45807_c0_g1_i1.p1  ORF type:complete len:293 (-),score=19.26 TRINITY_DN45807_c0_g1_i1:53-931(-)
MVTQLGVYQRVVCGVHNCPLDWSSKLCCDGRSGPLMTTCCLHWSDVVFERRSSNGWWTLGATNSLTVSIKATCMCNEQFSANHAFWGWSRGDKVHREMHCSSCNAKLHFLSHESGHWVNTFVPTRWIGGAINRFAPAATGFGTFRIVFDFDHFARCRIDRFVKFAVDGCFPKLLSRLAFLVGTRAEHHFLVLEGDGGGVFFLLQWGGQSRGPEVSLYDIILEQYTSFEGAVLAGHRGISSKTPWVVRSASVHHDVTVNDVAEFLRTEVGTVYEVTSANCQTLVEDVLGRFTQ